MMLARWSNPARLTSRGDWLKPAPASAVVASMVVAVAVQYRPNLRWPARAELPAAGERGGGQAEEHRDCCEVMYHAGAAGLRERVGCSCRVAADGSVAKTAAPIRPAPAAPIRARPARLLSAGSAACPRPAAPARTSVPVTAKFAVWTWPRGPSASELTGWRDGRYPGRHAAGWARQVNPARRPSTWDYPRSRPRLPMAGRPGMRGGRMTADGRCCPVSRPGA